MPLLNSEDLKHMLKTQGKPGHYLGTEIEEKWWKRYRKDGFFARGNGKYLHDDKAFYFLRYLTRKPITIPFVQVTAIKMGKSHAGRWCLGRSVVKIIWQKDDMRLSSGFILSRNEEEIQALVASLKGRVGL